MKQNVNFDIKADLWVKICEEQTSFSGTRLRINNKYANDFLTRIIMDFNLKCELSCGYNWIKVDLSRKIGCPYWRAVFYCKNCKSKSRKSPIQLKITLLLKLFLMIKIYVKKL
jgi:hypothetical protein